MAAERRTRASWERLVAEAERTGSIARTAERHGVRPKTLAWWRWTLRRERETTTKEQQLLPVVFRAEPAATASSAEPIMIELRDVSGRVPIGSDVSYVAALVAAVRTTC